MDKRVVNRNIARKIVSQTNNGVSTNLRTVRLSTEVETRLFGKYNLKARNKFARRFRSTLIQEHRSFRVIMKRVIEPHEEHFHCGLGSSRNANVNEQLGPDVAEDPEHLVVYGGSGKAAHDQPAFDRLHPLFNP